MSSKYRWAVYQDGVQDAVGSVMSIGAPPTGIERILVSLHTTETEAIEALEALRQQAENDTPEYWLPGHAWKKPLYDYDGYDPAEYQPEQLGWGGMVSRAQMHRMNLRKLAQEMTPCK